MRHWVQVSNVGVYGNQGEHWVRETTVPQPNYSAGRIALGAEAAVMQAAGPMELGILRLPAVFGAEIRGGEAYIPAPLYAGTGENWLSYVHVRDVTSALVQMVNRRYAGLLHLSDGVPLRAYEAARLIGDARRVPVRSCPLEQVHSIFSESAAGILTNSVRLSPEKACIDLGLNHLTTLSDLLEGFQTKLGR